MKTRLLILSNGLYPDRRSGTPYWCSLVAHALADRWTVSVLAPSNDAPTAPCRPVERFVDDIRLLSWRELPEAQRDYIRDYFAPALDAALDDTLAREKPEAVLVLNFGGLSSTIAIACLARGIPLYFYVNDVSPFCFQGYFNRPLEGPCVTSVGGTGCATCLERRQHTSDGARIAALRQWGSLLLRSFAGIAAPTRWFCDRLASEASDNEIDRYRVIRYGLPPARPSPHEKPRSDITFGFFGGNQRRKGGAFLLSSLTRVRREKPDVRFMLRWFGDGAIAPPPELRDWIEVRGFVTVETLLREFAEIDISLFPSTGEVLPLTMLQSLQHCVPVIATDLGGYRELLPNGSGSLLVEPSEVSWACAIENALTRRVRLHADSSVVPPITTTAEQIDLLLREPRPPRVTPKELRNGMLAVERQLNP